MCTLSLRTAAAGCLAAALGLASPAAAQHAGDVLVAVVDGRLATGRIRADQTLTIPERVFTADFGDSGFPGFTQDPGFEALDGTLPIGSRIGWNATAGLRVWNGSGFDPELESTIEVSFASLDFVIGSDPVAGFDLAVGSNGDLHKHLNFVLSGPGGLVPGVYLVEFELYSTAAGIENSDPFWLVFQHLAPDEQGPAADWVVENLVGSGPACPADLDLDGAVGLGDLLAVLALWGPCAECPEDTDGDGSVGLTDLITVLSAWGPCPADP